MSARLYRKAAAISLVAAVGLSLAACGSGKDSATASGGKTTITVDCPPLKTSNGGKDLQNWNNDVAKFEKLHPDIEIKTISVGAQCDNPPDFTARLSRRHRGRCLLRLHDRPQPGARLRSGAGDHEVHRQELGPELGQPRRQHQEAVHGRRQGLRHRLRRLHHGPGHQQEPVHAGRPRPDASRRPPGRTSPRRQEDRGARQRRLRLPGVQRRQHRWLALHRLALLPWRRRRVAGRQDRDRQHPGGRRRPAEPARHAMERQQRGRQAAADLAGPADRRRCRQGRHVRRRAGHHHRDRHHLPRQVRRLGDRPDARRQRPRPRAPSVAAPATSSRRA